MGVMGFVHGAERGLPKEMIMGSKALDGGVTPLHVAIALRYFRSQDYDAIAYTGRASDARTKSIYIFTVTTGHPENSTVHLAGWPFIQTPNHLSCMN